MRLVHHIGVGGGQDIAEAILLQPQIRAQQMVIDHHQIRRLGLPPRLIHMAILQQRAVRTQAIVGGGCHPGPNAAVFGDIRNLGQIAGMGHRSPIADAGQMSCLLPTGQATRAAHLLQTIETQVIRPPLEQGGLRRPAQSLGNQGQVLVKQLVLQIAGAGGNDDLAARKQHRNQISEGLAGTRARLHHQRAEPFDGPAHCVGHALLLFARGKALNAFRQGAVRTQ